MPDQPDANDAIHANNHAKLSRLDRLTVDYTRWVIRWRWLVLIGSLLVVFATATGLPKGGFDNDYRVFFGKNNPQLLAFEELQARYTKNDNVLFLLAPKDGAVFANQTLDAVEWLTNEAWQIPYSIRVDSISNFQHSAAEGDDLTVADLIAGAREWSAEQITAAQEVAVAEPVLLHRLIPERGHVTAVNVTVHMPEKHQYEVQETAAAAREMAAKFAETYPDIDVYLTGIVMLNNAFPEASMIDLSTLFPIMYGVLILMIVLLFRAITATIGTILVIVLSTVMAMGLAFHMGIKLTPPSASAPIMIMTLAVADSIHILVSMLSFMRRGASRNDALVEALRLNMMPVFLTSLTTIIGFLSLNSSDAPPFHDLGNITALGVAAAFFLSVTFLPAFMAAMPVRVRPRASGQVTVMDRVAEFVIARRQPLLYGMGALVLVLIAFIPTIELNDRFVQYFDETITFRTDSDFTSENLSGIYAIEYSIDSGVSGGVSDPEYLRHLDAFTEWYRAQPEAVHVQSLTDIMKKLNRNMHADDPEWYTLPDARDLSAQYLLLFEMSLPYGLDLNNQINVDKSATRFIVTTKDISTREVRALEARAQTWLSDNVPEHMRAQGSGSFVMFAHISKRNIESMLIGTSAALVLISLSLMLFLRTVKFGLISLVPNLVPAGMAFGLWAIVVGQANVGVSIVTAMSLGIVVDFTVHFLSKYLRARREDGRGPEDAVRYAFNTVGMALWITSLVLIAGFLVLSQSTFQLNAWMGLLTAITIALALAADFLLLPPILLKLDRDRTPAAEPATAPAQA